VSTIFIGGSRHISRLSPEIKQRLDNVISSLHHVVVGDANGADRAVQNHFHDACYEKVTVFSSGEPRNNVGLWPAIIINPPQHAKGFQFYAAKDREMAKRADFGLMIWDGKSPGTLLNVLRLTCAGKIAVLFSTPEKRAINIKGPADWNALLSRFSDQLLSDLRARATPEEWGVVQDGSASHVAGASGHSLPSGAASSQFVFAASLNAALAEADPAAAIDALGSLARAHGMTQIAKETGLSRESLYRALGVGGNPEFATVLKVMSCLGLHLTASTSCPIELAAE